MQDTSPAEIKRVVAFVLSAEETGYTLVLAVQQLTSVLICRHEACSIVRAAGKDLIAKMKFFLQQETNMADSSRNDFFYAMMWM